MNAAEQQAQAQDDVDRIARELADALGRYPSSNMVRRAVRDLLSRDVIRVGRRPIVQRSIEGQTTIDDEDAGSFRSDLAQARELSARQAALT